MAEKFLIRGDNRAKATYLSGNPETGKSSLIKNMALQDIRNGWGVCVIDPHRDLIDDLIQWIPAQRVNDTILFDTKDPVPVDLLSYNDETDCEILADQLADIFALENAPISKPLVAQIITAVLEAHHNPKIPDEKRCTFLDIKNFIENKDRRHEILQYAPRFINDLPDERFKKQGDFESITGRLRPFTTYPSLQKIFDDRHPKLNILDVLRTRKILLVNLRATPNDYFIASVLISKFRQAMFMRAIDEREPYYLYIDEAHHVMKFCAPTFEEFLTAARKFKLCITFSNQIASDLPKEIRNKLSLVYTKLHFVQKGIAHLRSDRTDFGLFAIKPLGTSPASYADKIRKHTFDTYAGNSQNRSGDNSASQTKPKMLELEEDGRTLLSHREQKSDS